MGTETEASQAPPSQASNGPAKSAPNDDQATPDALSAHSLQTPPDTPDGGNDSSDQQLIDLADLAKGSTSERKADGLGSDSEKTASVEDSKGKQRPNVSKGEDGDGELSDGSDLDMYQDDYRPMSDLNYGTEATAKGVRARRKQAVKRLKQLRDYSVGMEERMSFIEREMAELRKTAKLKDTYEDGNENGNRITVCKAIKLSWDEFRKLRITRKDASEVYAIEILDEEPDVEYVPPVWALLDSGVGRARKKNADGGPGNTTTRAAGPIAAGPIAANPLNLVGTSETAHPRLPERIRINSLPLIRILKKLREMTPSDEPFTVFRPFRLFFHFAEDLRLWRNRIAKENGEVELTKSFFPSFPTDPMIEGPILEEEEIGPSAKQYPKGTDTIEAMRDLDCLLEVIKELQNHTKNIDRTGLVSFDELWFLFKPGEEVIAATEPLQVYRVVQITGVKHGSGNLFGWRGTEVRVHCKYMDSTGTSIGPVEKVFDILKFKGVQKITSLPVYPFRFSTKEDEIRERLLIRGRRFLELLSIKHVQSHGTISALDTKEIVDSQVVVDFEQALQHESKWAPKLDEEVTDPSAIPLVQEEWEGCQLEGCCDEDDAPVLMDLELDNLQAREVARAKMATMLFTRPFKKEEIDSFDPEEVVLFTHRVFAFILRNRKWARFHIDDLIDIEHLDDKDGYDRLILRPGHKETVKALVEQHFEARESLNDKEQVDLVRGKGKGLIILLHGAPGVGKTSTAECIAEKFAKPLYPITCGDLGITPTEVENRLELCFTLAHRWGCILLLDEADIFLGERTREDFLRNSLVSVFLRVLEYYSGILFLTTNRVGALDEAFKSRIHLSLYYPPLDWDATRKIWNMNLERIHEQKASLKIKSAEIREYARATFGPKAAKKANAQLWNGRQIRNAFQTAIALAKSEAKAKMENKGWQKGDPKIQPVLRAKQFKEVVKASKEFDRYMLAVYRKTDAKRTFEQNLRFDKFDNTTAATGQFMTPVQHQQQVGMPHGATFPQLGQQMGHFANVAPVPGLRRSNTGKLKAKGKKVVAKVEDSEEEEEDEDEEDSEDDDDDDDDEDDEDDEDEDDEDDEDEDEDEEEEEEEEDEEEEEEEEESEEEVVVVKKKVKSGDKGKKGKVKEVKEVAKEKPKAKVKSKTVAKATVVKKKTARG